MSTPDLAKARAGVQRLGFGLDLVSFSLDLPGHHPSCNRDACEVLCSGEGYKETVDVNGYATPSPLNSGCYDVLSADTVYPIAAGPFMRDEEGIRNIDNGLGPFDLKHPTMPLDDYLEAVERFRAPWHTTAEISALADKQEDWLWEPFVLFGGLTLLIADSGAGKSTFTTSLLNAVLRGEPFLGFPTHKALVFYVSEESVKGIRRRTESPESSAVLDSPLIHWMYWGQKVKVKVRDTNGAILKDPQGKDMEAWSPITWEIIREEVKKSIEQYRRTSPHPLPVLLVIDTLSFWLEMDDSSGAMDVIGALKPLREFAADTGIGIWGLHHSNRQVEQRSNRTKATYSGSVQWRAQSDVMLLLQYAPLSLENPLSKNSRILEMYKTRFDEMPDLRIRYDKQRGYYRATPTPEQPVGADGLEAGSASPNGLSDLDRKVLAAYPRLESKELSQASLADECDVNRSTIGRSLDRLKKKGHIT